MNTSKPFPQLSIMDLTGKIIYLHRNFASNDLLTFTNIPKGMYLVVCTDINNKKNYLKLMIQ